MGSGEVRGRSVDRLPSCRVDVLDDGFEIIPVGQRTGYGGEPERSGRGRLERVVVGRDQYGRGSTSPLDDDSLSCACSIEQLGEPSLSLGHSDRFDRIRTR